MAKRGLNKSSEHWLRLLDSKVSKLWALLLILTLWNFSRVLESFVLLDLHLKLPWLSYIRVSLHCKTIKKWIWVCLFLININFVKLIACYWTNFGIVVAKSWLKSDFEPLKIQFLMSLVPNYLQNHLFHGGHIYYFQNSVLQMCFFVQYGLKIILA